MVQLDRHLVFAGGLDRMFQNQAMTIDLVAEFVLQSLDQILRGDGTKRLAGLAGLQRKDDAQFADPAREFFRFV